MNYAHEVDYGSVGANTTEQVYQFAASATFVALIASLPFFSVRFGDSLSIPLLILAANFGLAVLRSVTTFRFVVPMNYFDFFVLLYFIVALLSLIASPTAGIMPLFKTAVYIAVYFGLKMTLAEFTSERTKRLAKWGVVGGTVCFCIVSATCLLLTGKISVLWGGFAYHRFTHALFSSLNTVLGGQQLQDFDGKDIMRNAVAEVFAFYVLGILAFQVRSRLVASVAIIANLFLALNMFSRRAFVSVIVGIFGGSVLRTEGLLKALVVIGIIGAVTAVVLVNQTNSRALKYGYESTQSRLQQYEEALDRFIASPVIGSGYGAKIEGGKKFVHNFILASAMMMGSPGLLLSCMIFITILASYLRGLVRSDGYDTYMLLVIPCIGLTVGGTVLGMMTVTSWVIIAIHSNCQMNLLDEYAEEQPNAAEDSETLIPPAVPQPIPSYSNN